jgi:Ca2+-binding EF-hand superfamily protein
MNKNESTPSNTLTDKEKSRYVAIFKQFDTNKDGQINVSEFKAGLEKYHIHMSIEKIKKELSKYDKDGTQTINLDEFIAIINDDKFTK